LYDGGRSWYTSGGGVATAWTEAEFTDHVLQGISWASGESAGDCTATVNAYYEKRVVDTTAEMPMELGPTPDGRVLYIERAGRIKIYKPDSDTTVLAGHLDVNYNLEDGLLGLAIDPNFASNNWIYLYYTPNGQIPENILSRFTMNGDQVDFASEKVLLRIPTQRLMCCHSAGHLLFDKDGHLWLTVGDNTSPYGSDAFSPIDERPGRFPGYDAQGTAANTNDLRGKILRIKPEADGTYSIPAGNLFPADGSQGRPEIYIMGVRSPHRMAIDSLDNTLYWGEVGPNAEANAARGPTGVDEINVARSPGNHGWPYCIGDNKPYVDYDFTTGVSRQPYDCSNLINDSPNNNGARNLPPARPALMWYKYGYSEDWPEFTDGKGRTSMAGFFYRYDPNSNAPYKLPQYFDNTLIHMEWSRNYLTEIKMDSNNAPLSLTRVWTWTGDNNMEWHAPIDMKIHPDGSIYIAEWGIDFQGSQSRISRLRYQLQGQDPICTITPSKNAGILPLEVSFSAEGSADYLGGSVTMKWDFDLDGNPDAEGLTAQRTFNTPGIQVVKLTVTDKSGRSSGCTASVVAGNDPAKITLDIPVPGSIFNWGDTIPYRARVDDLEDGSTAANPATIDCSSLNVLPGLGHDRHTHSALSFEGCSGQVVTSSEGHDTTTDDLFFVLDIHYTDRGAPDNVPGITSRVSLALHPAMTLAEYYTNSSGTGLTTQGDGPGQQKVSDIDDGDWLMFSDYSLLNIDTVTVRASSENQGIVEFRIGSKTGRVVASVPVSSTGANTFQDFTQLISDSHQYVQVEFSSQTTISKLTLNSASNDYPARLGVMIARNMNEPNPYGDPVDFVAIQDGAETTTFEFIPPLSDIKQLRIYQLGNEPSRTWGVHEIVALDSDGNKIDPSGWNLASTCNNNGNDLKMAIDNNDGTAWSCKEPIASGTQNLYLVFKASGGNTNNLMTLHWFRFNGRGVAGTSTLVKAIDCGLTDEDSYTGSDSVVYSADMYYSGGDTVKEVESITRTTDDLLYGTQRVGKEFSYAIPLDNNQPYQITLKFAELAFNTSGRRVFDVYGEDRLMVSNFDIVQTIGDRYMAVDLERTVVLHDGTLNLKFAASKDQASIGAIVISKLLQSSRITQVPGLIKGSYYRDGGSGIGFIDATPGNSGGGCRADDVDLKSFNSPASNCYVTDIESGEFLQYDLDAGVEDVFNIEFRVSANDKDQKSFEVYLDDQAITDTLQFSTDGSESNWITVRTETKGTLTRGYHLLRIIATSSNWNFDSMDFISKNGLTPSDLSPTTNNNQNGSAVAQISYILVALILAVML
jgi:glucose/arabinose dehydrogenase